MASGTRADGDATSDQYNKPSNAAENKAVGTASEAIADINAYEKEFQKWEQRAKQIIKKYRDERSEATNLRVVTRKFNILWSNTETLKSTLYGRVPRAQVERRFKDADPVGRTACEIAERAGNYIVDTSMFDWVMRIVVQDLLLPGRGIAWVNYHADLTDPQAPMGSDEDDLSKEDQNEAALEKIRETIEPIYVDYRDFGHSPKRTWQEVSRVWRICYMGRKQLVERFGEDLGNKLPLDKRADSNTEDKSPDTIHDTCGIYEVWDKKARKVCWVHKSEKDYLDEADPPVDLEDFWPCPRPLTATLTSDTLVPIPLYVLYQDQAAELDKITNRIGRFTDGLKLTGTYDASIPELSRLLSPNGTPDNILVGVANYAALKEKGGVSGAVDLLDLTMIQNTLTGLYAAREQVLSVIYQVTGIADIIRGSSNPNETATAQSIKGQFASLRIKDMQGEVARFARDLIRIIVEIAVEMFEPETLYDMVQADQFCKPTPKEQQRNQVLQQFGIPAPKPMEEFMQALRMLRDDKMRSFHIDIETDSTIALNEQEDKQAVTEFLQALGSFVQGFGPMIQTMPQLAPVAGEALLYATRRYKAGRSLENAIEKAVQGLVAQASQPKPPAPEEQKVKGQLQLMAAKQKSDERRDQQELAQNAQEHQQDLRFKAQDHAMDMQERQQDHAMTMKENADKARMSNIIALTKVSKVTGSN